MQLYATKQASEREDAPVLILIHGLFGMGSNLAGIARAMLAEFDVHNLDLRNHGRSPWAQTMSFAEMADDVRQYLDDQGISRCRVLGHSLGGKVAMELALAHPARVDGLLVADIAPVAYQGNHDDVFKGLAAVDLAALNTRNEAAAVLAEHVRDPGVQQFLVKNLYRDDDKQFAWRMNVAVLQAQYASLRAANSLPADGIVSPFDKPVLFLKGELSPYIQPEHRDEILARFPNAGFKMIAGTSHWLHAEKPAAFNQLALRFLQSL